jgi:hypothetical protein
MKKLAALLVAVALVSPAFAQNTTPQFTQAISKLHIVAPAAKPLLLHTGKPLTPDDKRQFLAAVVKSAPASGKKSQTSSVTPRTTPLIPSQIFSAPPSTITLTPQQLSQGNTFLVMGNPIFVDIHDSQIQFESGAGNSITFFINAQPNTAYYLAMQVGGLMSGSHFTVYTGSPYWHTQANSETFTDDLGPNEFAYGVVSNSTGYLVVTIYSSDSSWTFMNCEITSTTF